MTFIEVEVCPNSANESPKKNLINLDKVFKITPLKNNRVLVYLTNHEELLCQVSLEDMKKLLVRAPAPKVENEAGQ